MDASRRRGLPGLTYPEEYLRRLARELAERFAGVFSPPDRRAVRARVLHGFAPNVDEDHGPLENQVATALGDGRLAWLAVSDAMTE